MDDHHEFSTQIPAFLKVVAEYAVNGANNQFYQSRARILHSQHSTLCEGNRIDCRTNVNMLFQKLMNEYPCTKEILTCSNNSCESIYENRLETFEITASQVRKHGIQCMPVKVRSVLL